MKCLTNMERITLSTDIVMDMIKLYQYKGKDFYYQDILKSDLDYIIKETVEKELFFLSKLLKLNISENRLRLIIKKASEPKTKEEQLLYNLKEILFFLQIKVHDFDLIANEVFSLTKKIFYKIKDVNFNYEIKEVQVNLLREKKRVSNRKKLEEIMELYERKLRSQEYELTQLITNIYIDFLNSNIFNEGNELVGILLLYILMFREKFNMFKYISFFEILCEKKESFDKAVLQANFNWEDGFSQTTPLNRIIIQILLEGYNKIDSKIHEYEFDVQLNKSDNIENTIYKLPQVFTKNEIRAKHPYVSDSTINRTLQRLRDENKIRPNGTGRSATWIRLIEQEKFSPNIKQINLFEFTTDEL